MSKGNIKNHHLFIQVVLDVKFVAWPQPPPPKTSTPPTLVYTLETVGQVTRWKFLSIFGLYHHPSHQTFMDNKMDANLMFEPIFQFTMCCKTMFFYKKDVVPIFRCRKVQKLGWLKRLSSPKIEPPPSSLLPNPHPQITSSKQPQPIPW